MWLSVAKLALLYICILYRPRHSPENLGVSSRPFSFWQWPTYAQHIEFLAGMMYVFLRHALYPKADTTLIVNSLIQSILFLIFGRSEIFINILGFLALGLESTLPIPQFLRFVKGRESQRSIWRAFAVIKSRNPCMVFELRLYSDG